MSRRAQSYKEWMFEFNQDNTPSRELAFGAGYSNGYADASEDGFQEGQRERDNELLRTRLASAEKALSLILKHGQYTEVAGLREMIFTSAKSHFKKFPSGDK
jgi:flagellar biosynthesis/type III secretory pathway protein FliH